MDTSLGGVTIIRGYLYEAKQIVVSMSYEFRALCTCGTRLMSARRLLRLEFGFWGVTQCVEFG
ncbi:hypothetical protein SLEP1_g27653 [Rubroshorea leprosula]|uniref:Uncharacterized protein n=1 Tax=Rubroshorea leprosula TaxID=152421 RepID=A0AAV5JR17_9ROSI|nr:hypothetical protein SLEP1_g27653 [Rubroshorea leprosula]